MLDSLKPIQFGFFGFLGNFFPKKLPKWGVGRSPIKTVPHAGGAGREAPQRSSVEDSPPHIPYAVFSVILVVLQVRAQKRKRFLFAFFGEHPKQHFKKIRRFAVDNANAL